METLPGLHHVTAITGDASRNLAFYTRVLGMRLVKRTVNQDDVTAYHLFYADAAGRPGTDLTFFAWPAAGPNRPGAGTIALVSLAIPDASLDFWIKRFQDLGVAHGEVSSHGDRSAMLFTDPEGQRLELVEASLGEWHGEPWSRSPVPHSAAIRGLFGVTLDVAKGTSTMRIMTEVLGFHAADDAVLWTGAGGAGCEVRLRETRTQYGTPGRGGVHHVAFRTADDQTQQMWLERLDQVRLPHSPIIDRFYFHSLYFREPGGILFEIATDGPGFATDEPSEHLGERLALPPFLEPQRATIEAGLPPLVD
jgi:glyoxalase family protein